jgi:hypothetical protein
MNAIKGNRRNRTGSAMVAALAMSLVTVSGSTPVSAASSTTTNINDFTEYTVENPCTGETIQLSGITHVVVHQVVQNDGSVRVTVHQNLADVSGVGLTSGTNYRRPDHPRGEHLSQVPVTFSRAALPPLTRSPWASRPSRGSLRPR